MISVDTKNKELVCAHKHNRGRQWQPAGEPVRVDVHDFPDPEVPKAIPYGVYDIAANQGWVAVGDDHDTAAFAVNTIGRWWTRGRLCGIPINRIEHRLSSAITANWRGRPLTSHEVIVNLIANTTTDTGLTVRAELDRNYYPTGVKVTNKQLAAVPIRPHDWHGDWNYTIETTFS